MMWDSAKGFATIVLDSERPQRALKRVPVGLKDSGNMEKMVMILVFAGSNIRVLD